MSKLVLRDEKEDQDLEQKNIIKSKENEYLLLLYMIVLDPRNNKWVLRKLENKSRRVLYNNTYRQYQREQYQTGEFKDKINKKEKADKKKSTNRNQNIKVNKEENLKRQLSKGLLNTPESSHGHHKEERSPSNHDLSAQKKRPRKHSRVFKGNRLQWALVLEEVVNAKWNEISEVIMQATNKNIPHIKVRKTETYFKKTIPKLEIYKEISFLYQFIKKFKRLDKIHKKGKVWAEVEVPDLCKVPDENGNYRSKQLEGSSKRLHIQCKALGDVTNIIGKGKVNTNKLECLEVVRWKSEKKDI
ncbi:1749_t:CDS:2, partial [Gigaspora margarita]